jgi:hypothetical protein
MVRATVATSLVFVSLALFVSWISAAAAEKLAGATAPATAQPTAAQERLKEGQWIDLAALADPAQDAVAGTWQRSEGALSIMTPAGEARLMLPVAPAGDYELETKFTRPAGNDTVAFLLPVGSKRVLLAVSHFGGKATGLQFIDGKEPADQEGTSVRPGVIENNREYALHIKVSTQGSQAEITTTLDGQPCVHWKGALESLSMSSVWATPDKTCPAIGASHSKTVFAGVRMRMLSGEARSLRPAEKPVAPENPAKPEKAAPKDKAKEKAGTDKEPKWLDLLPFVDPAKDKIEGTWRRTDAGISLEDGPSGLLAIPVAPKGGYEVRVKFTRTSGDDTVAIVLPAGPKAVGLLLSFWHGLASGLGNIKGEDPRANETRVRPGRIENNVKHTVYAKVIAGPALAEITATLDDKPLVNWKGPTKDLSVFFCFELPKAEGLGLGISNSKIIWHSAELRMLSGDAKPMRPLARPAPAAK